ncbi:MAG TPA: PAS domain-containing protein [Aliidongia sp.]|nr:PAS domain-containing protein [Aliidongia sp.]
MNGDAFGPWSGHQIPEDRSDWHGFVAQCHDYWRRIAPPSRLPGRQHVWPGDMLPFLPHVWLLDVARAPLRFRYRLIGTAEVRVLGADLTGRWLDEVHGDTWDEPSVSDRLRFMAETGRPTWSRSPVLWGPDRSHQIIENCLLPLAADGATVDMILACSVLCNADGSAFRF